MQPLNVMPCSDYSYTTKSYMISLLIITCLFNIQYEMAAEFDANIYTLQQQTTKKRKGRAQNSGRIPQGVNGYGHAVYRCLRCEYSGYHYQVTEHMHNSCFPKNDLFAQNEDGSYKIPKYVDLEQYNKEHYGQQNFWACAYCGAIVSRQKFKNHFELHANPYLAMYVFDGCTEEIKVGRTKKDFSILKKENLDEPAEVLVNFSCNPTIKS